jgi:hypothetical protein
MKRPPKNQQGTLKRGVPFYYNCRRMTNGQKSSAGPQQTRQRESQQEVEVDEFLEEIGGYQLLQL